MNRYSDTAIRMREHKARRDYVLVRGTHGYSYYGERWNGGYGLCKTFEYATPVRREDAPAIVAANVDALAYIEPIGECHARHLARCFPHI